MKLTRAKRSGSSLKLKWKKQSGVSGYEIAMAVNK